MSSYILFFRALIEFISNPNEPLWKGCAYALSMFVVSEIRSLTHNFYYYTMYRIGAKIQTTLTLVVYKKVFIRIFII